MKQHSEYECNGGFFHQLLHSAQHYRLSSRRPHSCSPHYHSHCNEEHHFGHFPKQHTSTRQNPPPSHPFSLRGGWNICREHRVNKKSPLRYEGGKSPRTARFKCSKRLLRRSLSVFFQTLRDISRRRVRTTHPLPHPYPRRGGWNICREPRVNKKFLPPVLSVQVSPQTARSECSKEVVTTELKRLLPDTRRVVLEEVSEFEPGVSSEPPWGNAAGTLISFSLERCLGVCADKVV
ncbi:hypothetical protein CDAR_401551 [Caerostris darwini]|uniref:Uncharacterized protein n=1 Tax=Caerostris darwini TaxID=1538125 RepID=A0AAV4RY16_9ARAC|nr:hypothetical protein CDAR_401551 [Caerostris darwini]